MIAKEIILSALAAISAASCSYHEWLAVGMALHHEGYGVDVWVDWSRPDSRFHDGECEAKWASFGNSGNQVTGATILKLAQDKGWKTPSEPLDWEAEIRHDQPKTRFASPAEQLKQALEALFDRAEHVGYTINATFDEKTRKWKPTGVECSRTAGELIESLTRNPDDLGATIGDWNPEAGAWIAINPVDGGGRKVENITDFRHVLIESDTLPVEEQRRFYNEYRLPIATLTFSGGKSCHAVVKIDARNLAEYKRRVEIIFDFLTLHGFTVDLANSNPNRLSRLPGATRNGIEQTLEAVNIGAANWDEWISWIESLEDELPPVESLASFRDNAPPLPPDLIKGILRLGHKLLISGASKAAKSLLLMELAVAFAEGITWLDRNVKQGRVLYINLEIDRASFINRFKEIYKAKGLAGDHLGNIDIWTLRGHAVPLDKLVGRIIKRMEGKNYEAVIIDPIYKVITGDENSATDMGAFCNLFDEICTSTGAAAIYCHHHSKGAQGAKKARDRASGSGVFARDPDAQLDIIELVIPDEMKESALGTAWRMEGSLREFPEFAPVNFWFRYPLHERDDSLAVLSPEGSQDGNLSKSPKRSTKEGRYEALSTAFEICKEHGIAKTEALAEYLNVSEKTVQRYIKEFETEFENKKGIVYRIGGKDEKSDD